ncbi:MAG: hypothetical protein RDU30_01625 [Desulfovibrionaceae bacterium]|nr:hypothetical protein [Desulfovibrionaceae bacterium]
MDSIGFCDLGCRYASWPQKDGIDGSGSCRTFVALYCSLKDRPVHKNMPCRERRERDAPEGEATGAVPPRS